MNHCYSLIVMALIIELKCKAISTAQPSANYGMYSVYCECGICFISFALSLLDCKEITAFQVDFVVSASGNNSWLFNIAGATVNQCCC